MNPQMPPYDIGEWRTKPYAERVRMVCEAWALQGYGAPPLIYLAYLLKIAAYVGGWAFFCSFGADDGWFGRDDFIKAIVWSMAWEAVGFGCGSGPLTGRYLPPVGGFLYFLWPGTTKLPLFFGAPLIGGFRRTIVDVALYIAHYVFLFRILIAPEVTTELLLYPIVSLVVMGVLDKSLFLASRAEHYWVMLIVFCFPLESIAGAKIVWIAIWWWAATSKLNRHFPAVVCVMQSNGPLVPVWMRKMMYRSFPDDLRPSRLAAFLAHFGTAVEYTFPLVLVLSPGGEVTTAALLTMFVFHLFITGNVPMGVPIEWNVVMVYGAFFLFGKHASVSAFSVSSPVLIATLATMLFVMPVLGNFFPKWISFLLSMRYYAGNWAYSVWLFRGDSMKKLDEGLRKVAPLVDGQLKYFYDDDTITAMVSKVQAFRAMHLHGRALATLLPQAVDDLDAYEYMDGELIAGITLGWNFGDGHLHDERLLQAIQAQCGYEPGELVCVMVESQPMLGGGQAWRIVDAAEGEKARGTVRIDDLEAVQPWEAQRDIGYDASAAR